METEREQAWDALHAATSPGWQDGRPSYHDECREWLLYAFDPSERRRARDGALLAGNRSGEGATLKRQMPAGQGAIDVVRKYLANKGYPLEYEAARILARLGYQTWQGLTYVDNETEPAKVREFDVLATVEKSPAAKSTAEVGLVVECKASRDPWLVLTRFYERDELVSRDWVPTNTSKIGEGAFNGTAWHIPQRHGFSIVRAVPSDRSKVIDRSTETDRAYAAVISVTKAAEGRLRGIPQTVRGLLVPVLVTAGPLFQLGYGPDGEEILEPVVWQRLLWQGSSVRTTGTIVDVVTAQHLEAYGRMMAPALQGISDMLEDMPPDHWIA